MTDETIVAPAAETQNPSTAPADTPAAAEPNTNEDVGEKQAESTEAKPAKTAEQRELEYLRRKATKADRNNARLWQENQTLRESQQRPQATTQDDGEDKPIDRAQLEQIVTQRARQIAEAEKVNERCNALVEKGKKEFPDFTASVAAVGEELPLFDRGGKPTAALEAVLDADNPPALLDYLGKNPDIAAELADLTPTQLSRRLTRIEDGFAKPIRQPSNAPKPLEPVKASSAPSTPDPDKDPAGWIAWRNKTAKR